MKRERRPTVEGKNSSAGGPVRLFQLRYGEEDLLVVSSPLAGQAPDGLTPAQLEIARAVARGESNATIARNRGTSVHTVANQVATILARLGVGSRQQLGAAMSRKISRSS